MVDGSCEMNVIFADKFSKIMVNFPKQDREKIFAFAYHVKKFGLINLKGRNKSSDHVPTNDPNWRDKVAYAQKYQLWHYHIGIPDYSTANNGDLVSEYLLHYILGDDFIKIVDLSPHPPFTLPNLDDLV